MTHVNLTIVGNLGKDPELKYLPSGKAVCNFSIATSRSWTNSNGDRQESTTWYKIECWGRLAEVAAQYLAKGRQVLIESDSIEADAYTSRTGEPAASLKVTANKVIFLSQGGGGGNSGGGNSGEPSSPTPTPTPRRQAMPRA